MKFTLRIQETFIPPCSKGVALLMTLWIMTVLSILVLSFTAMTRTETLASVAFRQGTEKKFLAEAGIERGVMEMLFRGRQKNVAVLLEGLEPWMADGTPYTIPVGSGSVTVSLFDESGKVDINRTPEVILRNLLKNLEVTEEEADIIVDSIMDWRDADDAHRLHGAEADYYASLPLPYSPKNADFESVEELLLVRGMSAAILYGDGTKKGVHDFLTVYGRSNKINMNSAPREVLLATGMSEENVDAILQNRQVKGLTSLREAGVPEAYSAFLTAGYGNVFTIDAVGRSSDGQGGYAIRATVTGDTKKQYRYLSYKSPVDTIHE